MADNVSFACPSCGQRLPAPSGDVMCCPRDGYQFRRVDGVWRFLTPEREAYFARFIREYEAVRRGENRGSEEPAYYRALPFTDTSGRRSQEWRIRALSYRKLIASVVAPMEKGEPLRLLDLGCGNGWLSYRLARRGHRLMAVDLALNPWDGLGTHRHYDTPFTPVQAEFDRLPSPDGQFELALFNASLHYSPRFERTLGEALRVVAHNGVVVIVDTPLYHDGSSGKEMVRQRQETYQHQFGFPSDSLGSEEFLTYRRLEQLAASLGVQATLYWPVSRWRWQWRRWRARWRGHREPAQFPLIQLSKRVVDG